MSLENFCIFNIYLGDDSSMQQWNTRMLQVVLYNKLPQGLDREIATHYPTLIFSLIVAENKTFMLSISL